ncbi:MAG: hypothetical protein AUK25_13935 [Desulfobacteraceae bacterium CG2_30_51_40]|nr:MAG: hypothetical protein AUK25_13935 [Desulfobacteraceae bacterium CG2_30_51_40]
MRNKNKRIFWLLGIFLLAGSIVFAQEEDVEGSKDHPLISRYPGSIIEEYDVKQFDEYVFPLTRDKEGDVTKSQQLEGKVTKITYRASKDRSTLEISRNYELALKKAGFEILFTGVGKEHWGDKVRFLSAKKSSADGDVYVSISVKRWEEPRVLLDIIEMKPMETGLVTVNAEVLAEDITTTGHVAIYGIYFDTGKADVKPESDPVLKEIAKLLQQNPKLNLYVVGHTDNVGTLNSNMELSKLRAEAVVKALISRHGIDSKRLHPVGVGPLSPVSSNKTEEGRAKNRRVELVEQ